MPKGKERRERKEAWFRIIVAIVSGFVLGMWAYLISVLALISWFIAVFTGRRNREIAEFCEYFNTERYKFCRYLTFVSNKRPFPFSSLERISKFE
jgi:hypothetical protein